MIFDEIIGIQTRIDGFNILLREAVRAVIIKNNKILMVHNNKGDYKFPGGGVEEGEGEEHSNAIVREVLEETGYLVSNIEEKIGLVIERKKDSHKENTLFEMTSYYYICNVSEEKREQELDEYEAKLEFKPVWISIEDAIQFNERLIAEKKDNNPWVIREIYVLKRLKEYYFD